MVKVNAMPAMHSVLPGLGAPRSADLCCSAQAEVFLVTPQIRVFFFHGRDSESFQGREGDPDTSPPNSLFPLWPLQFGPGDGAFGGGIGLRLSFPQPECPKPSVNH